MIYLIGGAGNGNFGDELIVRGWLEFLRETGVAESIVCDENYASIPGASSARCSPRSASPTTSTG